MIPPAAGPDETREAGLLAACPRCGYLLHGLPVQHRCPECGLELDRRWQVFGGRHVSRARMRINQGLALLMIAMVCIWLFLLVSQWSRGFKPAVAGFVLPICALWALLRKPVCFIGVGPAGICVYRRRRTEHYGWTGVGKARLDWTEKYIIFGWSSGAIRLRVDEFFGAGGHTDAGRCVQIINRHSRADSP